MRNPVVSGSGPGEEVGVDGDVTGTRELGFLSLRRPFVPTDVGHGPSLYGPRTLARKRSVNDVNNFLRSNQCSICSVFCNPERVTRSPCPTHTQSLSFSLKFRPSVKPEGSLSHTPRLPLFFAFVGVGVYRLLKGFPYLPPGASHRPPSRPRHGGSCSRVQTRSETTREGTE